MSIKAGQSFWEGPKVNAAVSAELSDDGRIPHSPALPAVARWLAADDGNGDLLRSLAVITVNADIFRPGSESEKRVRALLAALTTEEPA